MRRHATLASVSKRPEYGIATAEETAKFLDDTAAFARRASRMGADILAFPEAYPQLRPGSLAKYAEPEEGGTLDTIRHLARDYKMYIVWPRIERTSEGRLYNSSVLVDRQGQVVGRYHKMFPTVSELEEDILPGTSCPIFETDFGRIAMIICFDLNFMEIRDELRPQQPDLVVFSSMYRGGIQCNEWALDLGSNFLSAIGAELGRIVDRGGQTLKLATYEALITHRVNMNKRMLHMDFNWGKMDDMLAKYGPELTFEYYTPEARYVIGYEREDRDVDEILHEFGLESLRDYYARSRRMRQQALRR